MNNHDLRRSRVFYRAHRAAANIAFLASALWVLLGCFDTAFSQEIVHGQIDRIEGNFVDASFARGVRPQSGDEGTVYYEVHVANDTARVHVARIRVVEVSAERLRAEIVERRAHVQPGYLVAVRTAPCFGAILVEGAPADATVSINGTPVMFRPGAPVEHVPCGVARIVARAPSHAEARTDVAVTRAVVTRVPLVLRPLTGVVVIRSLTPDTEVFIGGQRLGHLGPGSEEISVRVPVGSQTVRARRPGYRPWERALPVGADHPVVVAIELEPLSRPDVQPPGRPPGLPTTLPPIVMPPPASTAAATRPSPAIPEPLAPAVPSQAVVAPAPSGAVLSPPPVSGSSAAPRRVPLKISASGYGVLGGLFTILTAGILWNQYAVQVDDDTVIEWRIAAASVTTEAAAGRHRVRVLTRAKLGSPQVVYEDFIDVQENASNEVMVNFLTGVVVANGREGKLNLRMAR